jgi:hypothetical protein
MTKVNYYQQYLQKAKENSTTRTTSNSGERKEFMKWIYPKDVLNLKNKKIRILPQNNEVKSFFFSYNMHRFKAGMASRMCTCLNSKDRKGQLWGECPICNFLSNNRVNKDAFKNLINRETFIMLAYNYDDNKKYMTTVFQNILLDNIITEISELGEEEIEMVENEGFDLYFKEDENNYPAYRKIQISGITPLSDLDLNLETMEDLAVLAKPVSSTRYLEYAYNMLETGVNLYAPELVDELPKYRPDNANTSSKSKDDDYDKVISKNETSDELINNSSWGKEESVRSSSKNKPTKASPKNDEEESSSNGDEGWAELMNDLTI